MAIGIIRMLQLIATLTVAGPVGLVGVFNILEGEYYYSFMGEKVRVKFTARKQ